ncbi:hypothetical protein BN000_04952 [Neobacillus massiliamazoniensis]|uniref:Uncharacterized protein n=1 Tax=Neobacillus massiliamazoniensis TaxID=1499688 RepID=A0A0U1P3V6_9BACI|nr:hypothetical protein BN000_04952 [Neobacillus massiliamazoniensis]
MISLFKRADGGANQYKDQHELQSWSFFFVARRYSCEGKDGHMIVNKMER